MYTDSNGVSKSAGGWAKVAGIREVTMRKRLRDLNWPVERAISTPVGLNNHPNPDRAQAMARTKRNQKAYAKSVTAMLQEIKRRPCADCARQHDPEVMEFDHVPDRGVKEFQLSSAGSRKLPTIMAEVAKCDVVCANCHRRRTARRRELENLGL